MRGFVWRKSVYDNGFRCSCGNLLCEGGELKNAVELVLEGENNRLICGKCGKYVAYVIDVDAPEKAGSMLGNIDEYMKGKMS